MASSQTQEVMQQIDTLTRSIKSAPMSSRPEIAVRLEQKCEELEGILGTAWEFCGANASNDTAFDRFVDALKTYERGSDSLTLYRSSAASFGSIA